MLSLLFAKKKVVLIKERTESVWAKFTSKWFFYHRGKNTTSQIVIVTVRFSLVASPKKSPLWFCSGGGSFKKHKLFQYKFNVVGFIGGCQNVDYIFLQVFNLYGVSHHVVNARVGQLP